MVSYSFLILSTLREGVNSGLLRWLNREGKSSPVWHFTEFHDTQPGAGLSQRIHIHRCIDVFPQPATIQNCDSYLSEVPNISFLLKECLYSQIQLRITYLKVKEEVSTVPVLSRMPLTKLLQLFKLQSLIFKMKVH